MEEQGVLSGSTGIKLNSLVEVYWLKCKISVLKNRFVFAVLMPYQSVDA